MLTEQIKAIFGENSRRYGSPRIHAELRKRQVVCSLRRVKRLMRQAGLYAVPKRKRGRCKMPETLPETANLLVPQPDIVAANQVWYSDITFVKLRRPSRPARARDVQGASESAQGAGLNADELCGLLAA